MEAPKLLASYQ